MGIYEISLATMISINIILAVGLNMITGFCGQISLGHAAFYGIGAYCAAMVGKAGGSLPVSLLMGLVMAGVVGVIVGLTSLRVREDFLAIVTMGVGFLFVGVVRQQEVLGGELGISSIPSRGMGKLGFFALVLFLAALVTTFSFLIKRSWMGFAFDAVADDEDTASILSVDVTTYKENLIVGGYSRPKDHTVSGMDKVLNMFPRLAERLGQSTVSLSGGEQQMLTIGRALMSDPELLLVDELSLGLMPKIIDICYEVIAELNHGGLTIVLVEQSTQRALDVADQVCVLESGQTVWKGSELEARNSAAMIDSLLGLRDESGQIKITSSSEYRDLR